MEFHTQTLAKNLDPQEEALPKLSALIGEERKRRKIRIDNCASEAACTLSCLVKTAAAPIPLMYIAAISTTVGGASLVIIKVTL